MKYKTYGADQMAIGLLQTAAKAQASRAHAAETQAAVDKAPQEIKDAK